MIKRLTCLLILLCFIFCGCTKKEIEKDDLTVITERGKLIAGVRDDAAPFGFRDKNGNLTGFDIELSKIVAQALLGNENYVEFVPVTASNRIMKLLAGEVDILIAAMSITEQRKQILDFSVPYFIAGQAILVPSSSKATSLKDFENQKMIVVFGSTSERNLQTNVPGITVIGYKTYPEAYSALKQNKANGIIADDTILYGFALKDKSVKILPKRYSKEPYAVAFRKDEKSKRLLTQVNYITGNLIQTGRLNRLQEKWGIKH